MKRTNLLINLQNILVLIVVACICACKDHIPTDLARRQERNTHTQHITLSALNEGSPDSLWEQFFTQRGVRRIRGHFFVDDDRSLPLFKGRFNSMVVTNVEAKEAIMGFIKYLHYRNMTMRSINIVKAALYELDQAIIGFASSNKQFTYLESLTIQNNQIRDVGALIAALPNLKELFLDNNNFQQLPEAIGTLTKLKKLRVADNQLREIPHSITQLTNLTELDFSNNQLVQFPLLLIDTAKKISIQTEETDSVTSIKNPFPSLKVLFLKNNLIQEIPNYIGLFTKLERIYLDGNMIHTVPRTIAQLTKLSRLVLAQNKLKELPACMYSFVTLGQLNVSQNVWYRPEELTPVSCEELKKEAQKILPSSLSTLCMRCIAGPAQSLNSQTAIDLERLLPIGLSYKYLSYMYQKSSYWEEGNKYVYFIPLGSNNIPLSLDFSFAKLADLDNLLATIFKKGREKMVFQKRE